MKRQNKKIIRQRELVVLLFSIFYFLFSGIALAQFGSLPNLNMAPTLSLSADPVTPTPNAGLTVSANLSGITNVNNSNYAWFLNGARQSSASGVNKNRFSFQTEAIGTIYRVGVSVTTPDGGVLSDSILLTVSDLDLTWSASSEAPASYKGKLLPGPNSAVVVSARPLIYEPGTRNVFAIANLTYNWFLNDKLQKDKSGPNRPDFSFRNDAPTGAKNVRLEARTADGLTSLTKSADIAIVRPQILIYLADPQTNLPYGNALKKVILRDEVSVNFAAFNYFWNVGPKQIGWEWSVNNEKIAAISDKPWLASFDIPANILKPSILQIRLMAKNPVNAIESAESLVNMEIR